MISKVRYIHKPSGSIGIAIPILTAESLGIVPGQHLWVDWSQIMRDTEKIAELKLQSKAEETIENIEKKELNSQPCRQSTGTEGKQHGKRKQTSSKVQSGKR